MRTFKTIFASFLLLIAAHGFCAKKEITINKENGQITWKGKKFTGEHFGKVQIDKGYLNFESGELRGGTIEVNMDSLNCVDITDKEYNTKLVNHLKSEDFFSTQKFPTAKFEITSVLPAKGGKYDVKGNLTIKGITKPASLRVNISEEKDSFKYYGDLVFDRTDYDIKFKSKKFFESIGDKVIYDEVSLNIEFNVTKKLLKN
jgi:polyisoprenoid-binding protein YceI